MMNNITIKKSSRAKNLRISVHSDGRVIVSAPKLLPDIFVRRFIRQKSDWIEAKVKYFAERPVQPPVFSRRLSRKEYLARKDEALILVRQRLAHFNQFYNFPFNRVSIRNQKTRWGSCSKQKNLNFNYKIIHLTPQQQDYIVVHELCHLAQMNHGPKFWALVAQQIPNWKNIRKTIKKFEL